MKNGYLKEVFAVDPASHILFLNCWSADLERLHGGDLRWPPVALPAETWTGFEEIVLWESDRNRVLFKLNLRGWQRLRGDLKAWIPQVVAIEELLEPIEISLALEADANMIVNGDCSRISFLPMLEPRAIPEELFDQRERLIQRAVREGRHYDRGEKLRSDYYQEVLRTLLRQHDSLRWMQGWPETFAAIVEALTAETTPAQFQGADLEYLTRLGLQQGSISTADVEHSRHLQIALR